jgi:hypothetical protein
MALGPTQPPIQWVLGALSLGVKRPGHEADHSPPSSAEFKEWVELYLHSPICLHGVVLSLSTGTTLPLLWEVLRRGDIAPSNLNPSSRWRWVVSFTTRSLNHPPPFLAKEPPVPVGYDAGWAIEPTGLDAVAKRKKSLPFLYRKSKPGCPARSLVTILTELPRPWTDSR